MRRLWLRRPNKYPKFCRSSVSSYLLSCDVPGGRRTQCRQAGPGGDEGNTTMTQPITVDDSIQRAAIADLALAHRRATRAYDQRPTNATTAQVCELFAAVNTARLRLNDACDQYDAQAMTAASPRTE